MALILQVLIQEKREVLIKVVMAVAGVVREQIVGAITVNKLVQMVLLLIMAMYLEVLVDGR
jgi:hypothetical protein